MKYEGKKNICVTMYGDGSANQGQLYEASNMAGLWKLPVIYCAENNLYGMGTSIDRASHYTQLYKKFRGFAGLKLDGSNVFAVREGFKFCKQWVLENGPLFLEIDTYRYQGHSMSDPGISYRTKDEITDYKTKKDCNAFVRQLCLTHKVATEEELKKLEKDVKNRIEDEIERIKNDPLPPVEELYSDIYVNEKPNFIRGAEYQTSIFNSTKY
jgi:pyruvate dehydrogenase E1 component alpha subunit